MVEDTRTCNAHFYLDSSANEVTREEFLEEVREGWRAHMLYVGGGFVPLRVAVLTCNHRNFYGKDWGAAVSAFEEWAVNSGREEEVTGPGGELFGEYELHIEDIPQFPEEGE